MNSDIYNRTEMLIGAEGVARLKVSKVAVFGIGGVGSFAAEALARSGIGSITFVDKDVIDATNINRQLIALHSTIGKPKVEVMRDRVKDINPDINVEIHQIFYNPDNAGNFPLSEYDYIVDAIDNITAKLELIVRAKQADVPIISSMGAGNKMEPSAFEVADISKTSVCPLAKVMRKELKERGIKDLKVVYSKEIPLHIKPPGSIAFVPPVAGMIMAGEVVKDLLQKRIGG